MSPAEAGIPRGRVVFPALVQVHFDGACQPPRGGGIATYGFVVEGAGLGYEEKGLAVPPWSPQSTNNVAEYVAAIRALEWLRGVGFSGQVVLIGDSQLVVRQMRGEYRVRSEHLGSYHQHLEALTQGFAEVTFHWVPREENQRADELSKLALVDARAEAGRHRPAVLPRSIESGSPASPAAEDGAESSTGSDPDQVQRTV